MFAKIKLLHKYRRRNLWQLLYGSKWVSAGALIFGSDGRILLIKHRWRGQWEYPVGMTDGSESPLATARRELQEEVGLQLGELKLVGVDFFHRRTPNGNLVMTFGGAITHDQAAQLKLDPDEATAYTWATRDEALELVEPWLEKRLRELFSAYDSGCPVYLHKGEPVTPA
ncbi:MAG TPA: NUDIX hydrolase [Candidatus Saccharimonadia bacterium]